MFSSKARGWGLAAALIATPAAGAHLNLSVPPVLKYALSKLTPANITECLADTRQSPIAFADRGEVRCMKESQGVLLAVVKGNKAIPLRCMVEARATKEFPEPLSVAYTKEGQVFFVYPGRKQAFVFQAEVTRTA